MLPVAEAVKVAVLPAVTVELEGFPVITGGAGKTVSVAAVLLADPAEFVKTARY